MFSMSERVSGSDDMSIYGVNIMVARVNNRFDFVKYMWEKKTYFGQYSYIEFPTMDEQKDYFIDNYTANLDAEVEAIDSIFDFVIDRYGEDNLDRFLDPLTYDPDSIGASSTLAEMLALIGVYENKPWIHSEKKVAITANMDADGNVIPVGSVNLKAIVAEDNDAEIFIVPKDQIDE